eukprot:s77_g26.t1
MDLGAQFFGERSRDPDSVALVVLNEALPRVQVLEGVGDARAIWYEISGLSTREEQVRLLGLATYAFPPNRLVAERRDFWQKRLSEFRELRNKQLWSNSKFFLCGDLNIHVSGFSEQDDRLCRPVGREIWMLLTHRDSFNLAPRNPFGVPTHKDGAVLDHCLSHPALNISVEVASKRHLLNSDHHPFILTVEHCKLGASDENLTHGVMWEQHEGWTEATNTCRKTMFFIGALALAQSPQVRQWVAGGARKKLRQRLVDLVNWWYYAAVVMVGDLMGMTRLIRFSSGTGRVKISDTLKELLSHAATGDYTEETGLDDDVRAQIDLQFNAPKLLKLQRLFLDDAPSAQRFPSSFLTPKAPLQLGLRDPTTGEELSLHEALHEVERDILHRSDKAEAVDPVFHARIRQEVAQLPAAAVRQPKRWGLDQILGSQWQESSKLEFGEFLLAALVLDPAFRLSAEELLECCSFLNPEAPKEPRPGRNITGKTDISSDSKDGETPKLL